MQLRLVHALSLLLAGAVAAALLAMSLVMAWNLQEGFNAYLDARDEGRLAQFGALIEREIEAAGGLAALRAQDPSLRRLLRQFGQQEGVAPPGPRPPGGRVGGGPEGPERMDRPPPDRGPPPGGPDSFGRRVGLSTADGQAVWPPRLLGEPPSRWFERPVLWQGQEVARLRLAAAPPAPDALQVRFLRSQYLGMAGAAVLLLALAVAGAAVWAARWTRPLRELQHATARLARGEFALRLPEQRRAGIVELDALVHDVNRMAEGLQSLEGARRRWLAEISHELRTPLTVLRGEVDALLDGVRTPSAAALRSLHDEVLRLGALVDDLHLLAMSDLKAVPLHRAELDAAALLHDIGTRFEHRATARGLALRVDGPPRMRLLGDVQALERMFSNLVENSLRYTDAPGQVRLAWRGEGGCLWAEIDDSAPAVPSGDLPRLFEPLYRADAARSRAHGGSGLGLAIARAIAEAHGGRIEASLSPLGGLRMAVQLPLAGNQG